MLQRWTFKSVHRTRAADKVLSPICSLAPNYYSIHVCQFSLAYQQIYLQEFSQQESGTARPCQPPQSLNATL